MTEEEDCSFLVRLICRRSFFCKFFNADFYLAQFTVMFIFIFRQLQLGPNGSNGQGLLLELYVGNNRQYLQFQMVFLPNVLTLAGLPAIVESLVLLAFLLLLSSLLLLAFLLFLAFLLLLVSLLILASHFRGVFSYCTAQYTLYQCTMKHIMLSDYRNIEYRIGEFQKLSDYRISN